MFSDRDSTQQELCETLKHPSAKTNDDESFLMLLNKLWSKISKLDQLPNKQNTHPTMCGYLIWVFNLLSREFQIIVFTRHKASKYALLFSA